MGGQGGIKRHGVIACDSCGRDFSSRENDWNCPRCGFDNGIAMRERGKSSYEKVNMAVKKSVMKRHGQDGSGSGS